MEPFYTFLLFHKLVGYYCRSDALSESSILYLLLSGLGSMFIGGRIVDEFVTGEVDLKGGTKDFMNGLGNQVRHR